MMGKSVTAIIITIIPTIKPLVGTKQGQSTDLLLAEQRSEKEREEKWNTNRREETKKDYC